MIGLLSKQDYNKIIDLGKEYDSLFETKILNNNDKIIYYQDNGQITGFLIIEETIDEDSIILLYVSKNFRRKKIASRLLDYYLENSTKNRVLLEVNKNNLAAIYLYKKYGFKEINTRQKYYNDGSDALIMEKRKDYE